MKLMITPLRLAVFALEFIDIFEQTTECGEEEEEGGEACAWFEIKNKDHVACLIKMHLLMLGESIESC